MTLKHRLVEWFMRLLALGLIGCGGTIAYSGVSFLSQSNQPFLENLRALTGTIQELDRTVISLREQSIGFDSYLGVLQGSLAKTKADLKVIDTLATDMLERTGKSTVQLLNETAAAVSNASKVIKETANNAGGIPLDPLSEQRKGLYSIADNFTAISTTLKTTAVGLSVQAQQLLDITSRNLDTSKEVVGSTEEQIAILRKGPVERIPVVLQALSTQLMAHVKLIDASYNLLNQISQPVIAVGVGFILIGMRGLLRRQSVVIDSISVK